MNWDICSNDHIIYHKDQTSKFEQLIALLVNFACELEIYM